MKKYNKILDTFLSTVAGLDALVEENSNKVIKLKEKIARVEAKIQKKIDKVNIVSTELTEEAAASAKTAKKIKELLDIG
jgi:hypothetical protein